MLVALSSIPVDAKEVKVPVCVIPVYAPDNLADGTVPEDKLEAFKEDPSMNPLSLLKPDIAIFAFVNFFEHLLNQLQQKNLRLHQMLK